MEVIRYIDHLDTALGHRIQACPAAARLGLGPLAVDANGVIALHAVAIALDQLVGGADDVAAGAVVLHQEDRLDRIVRLKLADEATLAPRKP